MHWSVKAVDDNTQKIQSRKPKWRIMRKIFLLVLTRVSHCSTTGRVSNFLVDLGTIVLCRGVAMPRRRLRQRQRHKDVFGRTGMWVIAFSHCTVTEQQGLGSVHGHGQGNVCTYGIACLYATYCYAYNITHQLTTAAHSAPVMNGRRDLNTMRRC